MYESVNSINGLKHPHYPLTTVSQDMEYIKNTGVNYMPEINRRENMNSGRFGSNENMSMGLSEFVFAYF